MKILQLSDIHWSKTSSMLDEYKNLRDDMEEYLEAYMKQYPENSTISLFVETLPLVEKMNNIKR